MTFFYRYSVRHPKLVIALGVLATLAAAPGMLRLKIRTDGHALVPHDAPAIAIDNDIRRRFGVEDPIVVMIEANDPQHGIFNAHTLQLVQTLTDAFRAIPGINPETLFSLATEFNFRVRPGTLTMRRLLEPIPATPQEMDLLQQDIERIRLYTGTVVSRDGPPPSATAVMVGAPTGCDRIALYTRITEIIAAQGGIPETVSVIGAPVAEALLGTHILEDLGVPKFVLGHELEHARGRSEWFVPKSLYELRLLVARHVGLLPISMALMALTFIICFRSVTAAMLPLMEIAACLVFVFGMMGWFGVPVYLTIAVLPLILVASGVADEIHVFSRYVHNLNARPEADHRDVLIETGDEMSMAVVKTSLTTAVGCASFALSPLAPVQAFGVFTALGVVFCMFWSLMVLPAELALTSPARFATRRGLPAAGEPEVRRRSRFAALGAAVLRVRWLIILATVGIVAAAPYGVRKVVIQDSWINGFAAESDFHKATKRFNDLFLGTHILLVRVDAGHYDLEGDLDTKTLKDFTLALPGDLIDDPEQLVGDVLTISLPDDHPGSPEASPGLRRAREWPSHVLTAECIDGDIVITTPRTDGTPRFLLQLAPADKMHYRIVPRRFCDPADLRRVKALEEFIAAHQAETVADAHGPARYLETTNFMALAQKEEQRIVPPDARKVQWLWDQYKRIRGAPHLAQVVDEDFSQALITIFMKDANFRDTARLMADIRAYEKEHLAPVGMKLDFGGDVAVSQTLIDAIVTTQVRSLAGSVLGVLLITIVLGRSLVWGVICALPCALAVLLNFAVMGWTAMPLGVATSMFTGMTLGMGVDFAIHVMERFRRVRRAGLSADESVIDTVATTGPPVFIDAVSVALGFGVMMLSQVPANARLGGLVVISLVTCVAATLFLLPALLRVVRARA